jgi:drug/metabolite transporter (DMT)-like permease
MILPEARGLRQGARSVVAVNRRGWVVFALMCVIWGIPYLLIKVAVRDVDPATLVCMRTLIGALVLVPIAAARGELRPLLARWRPVLVYTVVEVGIPWLLLSKAETQLTSSLSGLLIAAVPLVGAILAFATGTRGHLGPVQITGLLMGVGGVAALAGLDVGSASLWSLAAVGAVVVGYATGPWIVSRHLSDAPRLGVVAVSLALTGLVYLPWALTTLPNRFPPATVVASVVTLGVVCTALAFPLFFVLIGDVGPVRATVITYVNPAVALLLGVWFLHEPFTTGTALGFVLVLAGSFLATRAPTARRASDPGLPDAVAAAGVQSSPN